VTAQPRDNVLLGVATIVLTGAVVAFGDALVKHANASFSAWQLYVVRAAMALPLLFVVAWLARGAIGGMRPKAIGWVALRSLFLMMMWLAYYVALPNLSLPVLAAGYYAGPLFMVLLSALLVREPVGPRRWLAVLIGFAGVLVVLRPGTDAFSFLTVMPVLAGFFYAVAAIVTRARLVAENPLVLSLGLNLGFLVFGVSASALLVLLPAPPADLAADQPFLLGPWVALGLREYGYIAVLAVIAVATGFSVAKAYQSGPPAIIGTFDYIYLVWAAFWSFLFFDVLPDRMTILGMFMIAGAGMLAIWSPKARPVAAEAG